MLEIQKFIKANVDWKKRLAAAPYNLIIKEDDDYVLFKYNQISSDFNEEICKEARGLILDKTNDFKVVRMAFYKFFNYGEPFAAQLDWTTATSTEKIDGSLMSVWFARGTWHLSTNSTINAFQAPLSEVGPKTFGELFESILPLKTFEEMSMSTSICFTFELCSRWNKVVLDYPEPKLYLLCARDMNTFQEYSRETLEVWAKRLGVEVPQEYNLNSKADYQALIDSFDDTHEGIVIKDANDNRVKLKTPLYFQLHRAANNGVLTAERALHLIRTNEVDEFLAYFGQYKTFISSLQDFYNEILSTLAEVELEVKKIKSCNNTQRKEFAEFAKKKEHPFLYFKAYDDYDLKSFVDNMSDAVFLKMFRYKEN